MSNQTNIINGVNYSFTNDRFGRPNQACYLNNGYLQVSNNINICNYSNFTITMWINIKSINNNSKLLNLNDYLVIELNNSTLLNLNEWTLLTIVSYSNMNVTRIYSNKTLKANSYKQNYRHSNNCLNKSFYIGNINAIIDDIKIYKGAMQSDEIATNHNLIEIKKLNQRNNIIYKKSLI